ncbi:hypothetical protein BT93_L2436 [Corymbia citriodora subsp. variegata]|uniref:Endonuclease/exonuclease/phosphatase domain-containing protein n=1 Tax=Corymbia citriodora subsp. variegata TaxID=360336 RepID=A0A8T0CJX5_CORYI|nr:hypothetical protein BT93_L2436 [Corymbia citriodora subsp. variegata]
MNVGFWNVRGLIDPVKQSEVRNFVKSNHLCCVGLIETKVPPSRSGTISSGLFPGWVWTANNAFSIRGRIWVGWNPLLVAFNVLHMSSQIIHGALIILSSGTSISLSVVYGEHTFVARRLLWNDLIQLSFSLRDSPWTVAGDFNAILDSSDYKGSPDIWIPAFDEFKECLEQAGLLDLRYVGFRFT